MKLLRILIIIVPLSMFILNSCKEQNNPENISGLYSINIDGTGERELASETSNYSFAGDKIIYDFISSMTLDGTAQRKLVPSNFFSNNNTPTDFSISHDGSKIVFSSITTTTGTKLFLMNSDGSNFSIINLPDTTSSKSSPHFSFDGKKIVFVTSYGICECNINGENFKKLLVNPSQKKIEYLEPRYTPDNNHIIYGEYNDSTYSYVALHLLNLSTKLDTEFFPITQYFWSKYEVSPNNFVMFVMGGSIHEINLKDFSDQILALGTDAHYSTDFSYITYIDPDNTSIDLLNLKTKEVQNIKPNGKFDSISEPKLTPDGTKIIFIGNKYVF